MKVLIIANNDVGLYKFRKELIAELIKKHEVYICLPEGEYISTFEKMGCKFVKCEFNRRGVNPISEIKLIRDYQRIIGNVKPHIVFTYTIKPNSYGGAICARKGIPYVPNITGLGSSVINGGILSKITIGLYKHGLKKAQRIYFQNKYNYQFMVNKGIEAKRCALLPGSGVNLKEHSFEKYSSEKDGIRFLFVGRIMKEKGIGEFLESAKIIKESHQNCFFDIVGDYEEKEYSDLIEEYEEEQIIKYWGKQSDVHSFMKTHHVLIQPSYHEGLSNVLLEAAACGRPVLASKIPGCIETFDEGVSGFGFEVQNVDSLVESINKILHLSENQREEMGIRGRKKIEKEFDRKIVIDSYLNELNYVNTK